MVFHWGYNPTDRVQKAPIYDWWGAHLAAVTFILHLFLGRGYFGAHLFFFFSTPSIEDFFFTPKHFCAWKPLPIDDSYITLGQWSYRKHCCSRRKRHPTQAVPARLGSNARSPGRIRPSWWTAEMSGSTNGFRWVSPGITRHSITYFGIKQYKLLAKLEWFFRKIMHCLGW